MGGYKIRYKYKYTIMTSSKPVVLLILDGWGHQPNGKGNAISKAVTPTWDALIKNCPSTLISGCGEDVGLPEGQMGNSEVGHLTMGAGRVIYQELTLINKSIREESFYRNTTLINAFEQAKKLNKSVHIMGLLSPGGVHSHEDHIFACLRMAAQNHVSNVYVHAFLDGRDTPPQSAKHSLEKLDSVLKETNSKLATVCGRYYAMDRDKRHERTQLAFNAIVFGKSPFHATSGILALEQSYARNEFDEFVKPTIIDHQTPITINDGDIVIYMNFRADRARALSNALTQENYEGFDRGHYPIISELVTLTEYEKSLKANVVFPTKAHVNVLGEYLQNLHLTQLHLAETEKYAHVTFFFNGGIEKPYQGEERILIPSPKVATYDLQPQMSAFELTDVLVENILQQKFDFIVCNYANADMVGHTGNFDATVKAIETLDQCLGKVVAALEKVGACALITSDHGNAECMLDEQNNQAHTAHTMSLVPLVYVGKQPFTFNDTKGTLSDIAPTILKLMDLKQPQEMTGHSLMS
jgi:2,3-bisphosphoglycerate-independent phosphoglycerate mutase